MYKIPEKPDVDDVMGFARAAFLRMIERRAEDEEALRKFYECLVRWAKGRDFSEWDEVHRALLEEDHKWIHVKDLRDNQEGSIDWWANSEDYAAEWWSVRAADMVQIFPTFPKRGVTSDQWYFGWIQGMAGYEEPSCLSDYRIRRSSI